jgi:hypothetical protein
MNSPTRQVLFVSKINKFARAVHVDWRASRARRRRATWGSENWDMKKRVIYAVSPKGTAFSLEKLLLSQYGVIWLKTTSAVLLSWRGSASDPGLARWEVSAGAHGA